MERQRPQILAHRGLSGHHHENSRAAFAAAAGAGADGVELDIHATLDGRLVVHHDPAIAGAGPIASLPWDAFRGVRLPNGEPLPLLGEVLDLLAGLTVWIEVKALPVDSEATLLETIARSERPELCAIHSFDHRIVRRLGNRKPDLRRGVLSTSYPVDLVGPIQAAGATALWQHADLIDAAMVAAVHGIGAKVIAWTVNDSAIARRLAVLGVDALCGNFPERLVLR